MAEYKILMGNTIIQNFMKDGYVPVQCKYHSSWDWLRPVIDEIFTHSLAHPEEAAKVCSMKVIVNIDAAWQRCVDFINYLKTLNNKDNG